MGHEERQFMESISRPMIKPRAKLDKLSFLGACFPSSWHSERDQAGIANPGLYSGAYYSFSERSSSALMSMILGPGSGDKQRKVRGLAIPKRACSDICVLEPARVCVHLAPELEGTKVVLFLT